MFVSINRKVAEQDSGKQIGKARQIADCVEISGTAEAYLE
jgi:hypothetical protein